MAVALLVLFQEAMAHVSWWERSRCDEMGLHTSGLVGTFFPMCAAILLGAYAHIFLLKCPWVAVSGEGQTQAV